MGTSTSFNSPEPDGFWENNRGEIITEQVAGSGGMFMGTMAGGTGIAFNVIDPDVVEAIRALDVQMGKRFRDEMADTIREWVEVGYRQGYNPRRTARYIKRAPGLASQHVDTVARFRKELETNSRTALRRQLRRNMVRLPDGSQQFVTGHAGGYGLGKRDMNMLDRVLGSERERLRPAQIDRLVRSYERRLIGWHAETLSRTATLDAMKVGNHQATAQAIEAGVLDPGLVISEWSAVMDGRVRPTHEAMHGEKVPFGTPFPNGQVIPGEGEYNCRCLKLDRLATKKERQEMGLVRTQPTLEGAVT